MVHQLQSIRIADNGQQWPQQPQQLQYHQQQRQQIESHLRARLEATGDLARLRRELQVRRSECGWRDGLRDRAQALIRQRGGTDATLDELVAELATTGRTAVPAEVRGMAIDRVRAAAGGEGVAD